MIQGGTNSTFPAIRLLWACNKLIAAFGSVYSSRSHFSLDTHIAVSEWKTGHTNAHTLPHQRQRKPPPPDPLMFKPPNMLKQLHIVWHNLHTFTVHTQTFPAHCPTDMFLVSPPPSLLGCALLTDTRPPRRPFLTNGGQMELCHCYCRAANQPLWGCCLALPFHRYLYLPSPDHVWKV